MEPPSSAYSASIRVTVQGDPGRAFRPTQGRNTRGIFTREYPPRCARRVLPRLRPAVGVYGPRGLRPLGYRRSGPAAPVLRDPPCAAACMARAASSLRSGTGHASRYVVGNVHRPRCSNALPILRRFAPSLSSPRDGDRYCGRSSPALTRAMACCVRERRARITPSPRLPPRNRGRLCPRSFPASSRPRVGMPAAKKSSRPANAPCGVAIATSIH